jgi:hypothetical protein
MPLFLWIGAFHASLYIGRPGPPRAAEIAIVGPFAIAMLAVGMLMWRSHLLYKNGLGLLRDARRPEIEPIGESDIPRAPFVLYLRAFSDDEARENVETPLAPFSFVFFSQLVSSGRTEEEALADVLSPIGDLIAVRSPQDRHTAPAGAKRLYLAEGEFWKEEVRDLLSEARFVVLAVGSSTGVLWEMFEILARTPTERFAFVVPMDKQEYKRFTKAAIQYLEKKSDPHTRRLVRKRFGDKMLPKFASLGRELHELRGVIYYTQTNEPRFVDLGIFAQSGSFIIGRTFGMLEAAFRPLIRRLVQYEEQSALSMEGDGGADWYRAWSRPVLPYVLGGTIAGVASFLTHGLVQGFQADYSIWQIALHYCSISAVVGATTRWRSFPKSDGQWTSVLSILSIGIMLTTGVILLLPAPYLHHRIATPFVLGYIFVAAFLGFAVTSAERLLDYALAGLVGVLVGQIFWVILETLLPNFHFVAVGYQIIVSLAATFGMARFLHRRLATRIIERIGIAESAIPSLGVYLIYVSWIGSDAIVEMPSISTVLSVLVLVAIAALVRLVIVWITLAEPVRFVMVALAVVSASNLLSVLF